MFCGFNVAMNGLTLIVALAKVKTKTVDELSEMESYQLWHPEYSFSFRNTPIFELDLHFGPNYTPA